MKVTIKIETESGVMGILGLLDELCYQVRRRQEIVDVDLSDDLPSDYTSEYDNCVGNYLLTVEED